MVMKKAQSTRGDRIRMLFDSELVVKQLNREYKVKNKRFSTIVFRSSQRFFEF